MLISSYKPAVSSGRGNNFPNSKRKDYFYAPKFWRRVRVVEGASLESLYTGNCIASSNLAVSAEKPNKAPLYGALLFFGSPKVYFQGLAEK